MIKLGSHMDAQKDFRKVVFLKEGSSREEDFSSSSLLYNITRSFCLVLVLWNLNVKNVVKGFLFVTSSFSIKKKSSSGE